MHVLGLLYQEYLGIGHLARYFNVDVLGQVRPLAHYSHQFFTIAGNPSKGDFLGNFLFLATGLMNID